MAIVLLDMDDVLADFEGRFFERWRTLYPDLFYIHPDQRDRFYVELQMPPELREKARAIKREPGFFLGLEPLPGAPEAARRMLELGHEVFICTAPITDCATCPMEKFQWAGRHLGPEWLKRVIIASDKTLVRGDFLVDDKPEITGSMTPLWEHVVFDRPYNRPALGKRRIADWRGDWRTVLGL